VTTGDSARGERNKNPGNIDRVAGVRWQGQADDQSSDPRFVVFTEPKWGVRAICRVLITYQDKHNIDSVREIIDRWAPPVENNTGAYINAVATSLGRTADAPTDVYEWYTMRGLVLAIIKHELGYQPYDDATIDAGLILAGLQIPGSKVNGAKTKTAKVVGAVASIAGAAASIAPDIMASLPEAKQTYDNVVVATSTMDTLLPWFSVACGVVSFAVILFIASRNKRLRKLINPEKEEVR
jgi:hypothetical protein